ncbi:MAG TPA: secretin N-terminal domain-containing protein, partial [Gemmatales bacterium]|nr:secretin N-terminal domain-containing protein [Gemmatales bacterium]
MQQAHGWKQRFVIATLASALCVALVGITAWGQEGPAKTTPAKDGPSLKPLAFEFRDTPWEKVLDWLADNSPGMPIVGSTKPQGTFNFFSPGGKKYTIPQVLDILNSSLIGQKIIILRNTSNYTVITHDEAPTIDTTILPNITIEDLEIDKPADQQKYGKSELCQITFNLNGLTVDEAETNLNSRKGPFGRFQKIPKGNMLLATDTVGNLRQMKKLLDKIDPANDGGGNLEVFVLRPSVNGAAMETTIKGMFNQNPGQSAPTPNGPKIQYDETQHKLLVTGDKVQLKLVREALTKLNAIKAAPTAVVEPGPGANQGNNVAKGPGPAEDAIRQVNLKAENASQFVDNLKYLLSSLRSNPVYVTFEPLMIQSIEDARKGVKPKDPVTGKDKELQLTDEKRPIPQISNKPGSPDKPVFIAPLSRTNGVMLGSDDPEALDFAEQILAYLTKEGDTYYEVIPLKYSNASIVRDTLDELINGKKQPQGGNPMMMMMGGGGGGMRDAITGPVVRLAADKRTNSILVRAPRQIVVTIKRFIETELDVNNIDGKLQPKPHIVKLQHANANDIVDVLKEIYREYIEQRTGGQPAMQFGPFGPQPAPAQPERSIKLSVSANPRDNSIILNCPDVLWEEVSNLLVQLDKNNAESDKEAVIINIGKADPQMLKQAIDTITG